MGGNLACVVYFVRAAHAFNAGNTCRNSIGINKYLSVHVWLITPDLYMNESNWVQFSFSYFSSPTEGNCPLRLSNAP